MGKRKKLFKDRFFAVSPNPGSFFQTFYGAVAKLNFATASVFFIFKHIYLQLNTLLPDKSTIFAAIFAFPQTISLSNIKKSSDARTNLFLSALRNIPRNHGGLLTPRIPVAHLAATSSARCLAFLTLERAHTRPYTDLRYTQIRPQTPGP